MRGAVPGLLDEMNNWSGPKYMIAEGDTYMKYPDDETFPQLIVNYVKLASVPKFDEDWSPIVKALCAQAITSYRAARCCCAIGHRGIGAQRTYSAEVEWTFPLEFVELVWGDGHTTGRQIVFRRRSCRRSAITSFGFRSSGGEEVGTVRGVGFGGQRRVHAAGSFTVNNETTMSKISVLCTDQAEG